MSGYFKNSDKKDWNTPSWILDGARQTFGGTIELDPCSNPTSIVQATHQCILPDNGLQHDWLQYNTIWVNPPYGRCEDGTSIKDWVAKCVEAGNAGRQVILLIPAAVESKHWQELIFPTFNSICFPKSRVRFFDAQTGIVGDSNVIGSGIIYWGNNTLTFADYFGKFGAIINQENVDAQYL